MKYSKIKLFGTSKTLFSRKGLIVPTTALLFVVLVLYAWSVYSVNPLGERAYIGERAADIISISNRMELNLFVLDKGFETIKDISFYSLADGFDVGRDAETQYLEVFNKEFGEYMETYKILYEKVEYEPKINNGELDFTVKLTSQSKNVKYVDSKVFNSIIDLSGFESVRSFCSGSELDCSKYSVDKCGMCNIDSSDNNYLKFESEIMVGGKKIPITYRVKRLESL